MSDNDKKILRVLNLSGNYLLPSEISRYSGLTIDEVKHACWRLYNSREINCKKIKCRYRYQSKPKITRAFYGDDMQLQVEAK